MDDGKERLERCQAELQARGYKDVKFFFQRIGKPMSEVASDVAELLEAVLQKKTKKFEPFNDSTRV